MANFLHVPVLLDAVLIHLALRPGSRCVDATVNGGGHAIAMLEATAPDGVVLGLDLDAKLLATARDRLAGFVACERLRLVHGNFRDLKNILAVHKMEFVDAVLFDLGVSSFHLDASGRGFSYTHEEPLDMRFNPDDDTVPTAAELLATQSSSALTEVFRNFGEERFASRIARTIIARRRHTPLTTSRHLFEAVAASLPPVHRRLAARHAARIFQALRIAVNDELGALACALPQAVSLLAPGGRLAVISFHSLEDRIVKNFFRSTAAAGALRIITKKPIRPDPAEVHANPRAASAKLRVAERSR